MPTASRPLPRLRDHLRVTLPGGYNAICREHGGRQWVRDAADARRICNVDRCTRTLKVQACPPEQISGTVREVSVSAQGNPIVRIGTPRTRDSQWINWDDVVVVEPQP